jgi:hypothetical protein
VDAGAGAGAAGTAAGALGTAAPVAGALPGTLGTSDPAAGAGAVKPCITPLSTVLDAGWCVSHAKPPVDTKKMMAAHFVVRDKKFAAPDAPNKLPAEPPPNDEPISAPLPCCNRTSKIMLSDDTTWTARRVGDNHCMK